MKKVMKIGDELIAIDRKEFSSHKPNAIWIEGMTEYVGQTGRIIGIKEDLVRLDFGGEARFWYPLAAYEIDNNKTF